MIEESIIQMIANNAGLAALAAFSIYMLKLVYDRWIADLKERAEAEREDKLRLADVLERNTKAMTELTAAVRTLNGKR